MKNWGPVRRYITFRHEERSRASGNMSVGLIRPKKERVWGWPAVANFLLGGTGAGFYLLSTVHQLWHTGPQPGAAGMVSPLLVSLGFLSLTLEAGRPLRGVYLLSNLRNSWMSVEVLAGGLFIFAAFADWLFPRTVLHVTAACASMGLIVSHGFIFYRSRAMTAWNLPVIPLLFLSSALVLGGGLLFMGSALSDDTLAYYTQVIVLACLVADAAVWAGYLLGSHEKNFVKATGLLRRPLAVFLVSGVGHLLPLVMVTVLMMTTDAAAETAVRPFTMALAGLCMLIGGVSQKVILVLGANYLRGMEMGRPGDHQQQEKTDQTLAGQAADCKHGPDGTCNKWQMDDIPGMTGHGRH